MTNENNNPTNAGQQRQNHLPIAKNEDVEFSRELADEEDMEAMKRMEAADRRQE
ncbi:YfhD family protein [Paenibacillus thermotolerans]|uniref:YfhD family protein n=1 Tax=Paenibacillus thermotolerans TaxID=3027807 RepID=UPI002368A3E7|nr:MULTISPECIES: YfhD family protein [unclassified Paenibacillus]